MNYKILLADDSVTVQKIITLTFSDEGVDVMSVNSGDEAIHRLQYMRPALVMADVSIPGKNGYEVCEFVKNHPELRNTPVILLVPAFEPFDEERARRIGADYHLTKPFQSIRTLISTVKNLIEPAATGPTLPLSPAQVETQPPVRTSGRSAKIEELIRQSAVPASASGEGLPDDLPDGLPNELPNELEEEEPFGYDHTPVPVTETYSITMTNESITERIGPGADEFDDILELDDVLPELAPVAPVVEVAETARPIADEAASAVVIPQHVIDEIVNRVVAELMEKMDRVFARRIAGELVQVINRPQPAQPVVARRGTDNLLEID